MENKRHCIICGENKPESDFNEEHIVPEKLGNHSLKTNRLCADCNGTLGGTVDSALIEFTGRVRCERGLKKGKPLKVDLNEFIDMSDSMLYGDFHGTQAFAIEKSKKGRQLSDNTIFVDDGTGKAYVFNLSNDHEINGALLKIAYEVAHLYLGDEWLSDVNAIEMREILAAFVKDKTNKTNYAKALIANNKQIRRISLDELYGNQTRRDIFVKIAKQKQTCVNSLGIKQYNDEKGNHSGLAVTLDIEGLPITYVIVSTSKWQCEKPILILP